MNRHATLSLYRSLIRTAKGFQEYNFRLYALRRIRTGFREASGPSESLADRYAGGLEQLASLRRQVTISQLYPETPSIMVNKSKK